VIDLSYEIFGHIPGTEEFQKPSKVFFTPLKTKDEYPWKQERLHRKEYYLHITCPKHKDTTWYTRAEKYLLELVKHLSEYNVKNLIFEINYNYRYQSHPELSIDGAIEPEQIIKLREICVKHNVNLIPQFNCLGHQSWQDFTYPLLEKYPEFDESSNDFDEFKSWCPNSNVNHIIFDLIDELIDVFNSTRFHVGMDEVFTIGKCPRCKNESNADLFAKAINDYHKFLSSRNNRMMMWGDRLLRCPVNNPHRYEFSLNNTHQAINKIPKNIIICDWHYIKTNRVNSIPYLLSQGFDVISASWNNSAKFQLTYNTKGHIFTTWIDVERICKSILNSDFRSSRISNCFYEILHS